MRLALLPELIDVTDKLTKAHNTEYYTAIPNHELHCSNTTQQSQTMNYTAIILMPALARRRKKKSQQNRSYH